MLTPSLLNCSLTRTEIIATTRTWHKNLFTTITKNLIQQWCLDRHIPLTARLPESTQESPYSGGRFVCISVSFGATTWIDYNR